MSAVADVRGLKRVCIACGTRFYDMNKRPITCPSCSTEFTGELKPKGRRGKVATEKSKEDVKSVKESQVKEASVVDEEDDEEEEEDLGVKDVSFDDDDIVSEEDDEDEDDEDDVDDVDLDDIDDIDDLDTDDDNTLLEEDDDDDLEGIID